MSSTTILNPKVYIENVEGCYRIVGKRVSLDSIVYAFSDGQSPETIVQSFPVLTIEEVYGAIAFYLANREAMDTYIAEGEALFETLRQEAREKNRDLYERIFPERMTHV